MHQPVQWITFWLLFLIPTASQPKPFFNTRTRGFFQITGGIAVVSMAGYILKNIISTATRRLSNPELKSSPSLAAVVRQTLVIFAHNKLLAGSVLGGFLVGIILIQKGLEKIGAKDSSTDSSCPLPDE